MIWHLRIYYNVIHIYFLMILPTDHTFIFTVSVTAHSSFTMETEMEEDRLFMEWLERRKNNAHHLTKLDRKLKEIRDRKMAENASKLSALTCSTVTLGGIIAYFTAGLGMYASIGLGSVAFASFLTYICLEIFQAFMRSKDMKDAGESFKKEQDTKKDISKFLSELRAHYNKFAPDEIHEKMNHHLIASLANKRNTEIPEEVFPQIMRMITKKLGISVVDLLSTLFTELSEDEWRQLSTALDQNSALMRGDKVYY